MVERIPHILIIDDEEHNREIILESLDEQPYKLSTAENGRIAWEMLESGPHDYDVILLDRMMPDLDGMAVLERIRKHHILKHCPVIMQTAKSSRVDVLEGIKAGAYYYLIKPFNPEIMISIVQSAVEERLEYLYLCQRLKNRSPAYGFIEKAQFQFQTPEEVGEISMLLASSCLQSEKVINGLSELMLNAVEHGNLGITYDEKTRLLESGSWSDEINHRLKLVENKHKYARIKFQRFDTSIEITITDSGKGFDWEKYMQFDPDRATDNHGRGIAMANCMYLSNIEYQGTGNIVKIFLLENKDTRSECSKPAECSKPVICNN